MQTQSDSKPTLEQRVQDLCDAIEAGGINKDTGTINDLGEMSILAFAQAVAAEAAPRAPRWIPVGERLPEQIDDVLFTDGRRVFLGWRDNEGFWLTNGSTQVVGGIKAWQPRPAAPEEQS